MNKSLKKFYIFITSFFIFLIHLPFVFAKMKPVAHKVSEISNLKNTPALSADTHSEPVSSDNSYVFDSLHLNMFGLSKQAFNYALEGLNNLRSMGKLNNDSIISIVDFSLSSSKKRLFVIDIKNLKILFNTYVAHGRNSGAEYATRFSNDPKSFESSLGFYVTKNTYKGTHGFSLHLEGEEKGINDNAYSRAIVMHSANYVNEKYIKSKGYIGRSLGCPALPPKIYKPIIEKIKGGSCLFMYSPDNYYLSHSTLLQQQAS